MLVGFNTTINSTERGLEKAGNNIKYGAAATAAVGAGVGAAKLATAGKKLFTPEGKEIAKAAGNSILDSLKSVGQKITSLNFYQGIYESLKTNVIKTSTSVKEVGVMKTVGKIATKAIDGVKLVGSKILGILPSFKTIKDSVINFVKGIPAVLKRIPALGWIAAATAALLLIISHKHGYNSGKIDQKYSDRQKLFERIG